MDELMETFIEPKILKGFRDFLPAQQTQRLNLQQKLQKVFASYGYVPIDTPVLEYASILLRKSAGETEKQMFRFVDNGGRDIGLRFDLTVPFARFVAQHKEELYFPFKRYHIAKVFRGEKPQAGRYREFMQCDFDSVGSDSVISDFETLCMIKDALFSVGIKNIKIKINHRGVFNRFLQRLGLTSQSQDILRTVDKLSKIGKDETFNLLQDITKDKGKAQDILTFIAGGGDFLSTLQLIEDAAGGAADDTNRLKQIYDMLCDLGMQDFYALEPCITRGLDYYTGVVFETFLNDLPSIGSVCSGGRYDNLTGLYTKQQISGVGGSVGLDRLIAGMQQLGIGQDAASDIDVMIFFDDRATAATINKSICLAKDLRGLGVSVDLFCEPKKMAVQYAVCEKKGIKYGITANESDFTLKDLATRNTQKLKTAKEIAKVLGK